MTPDEEKTRSRGMAEIPLVRCNSSIRETMAVIDRFAKGIAIVTDEGRRLVATITDGDIRRAILVGLDLDAPAQELLDRRGSTKAPVTAHVGTPEAQLIRTMNDLGIRQIPLLDDSGCVQGLSVLHELVKDMPLPVTGVVMAGGFGRRLMPLTADTPKPMLPLNGRPLLEHTIDKLRDAGIRDVHFTTHYRSDNIAEHFRDGRDFGVRISYVPEEQPLGTAGALAKFRDCEQPLLVINGDIVTGLDFRAMLDFHREHAARMTVAVRQYDIEVPFGVVETDGVNVTGIAEKPVVKHFINAGIYLIDPSACQLVPPGQSFDMPQLIEKLAAVGRVVCFPVREYWIDVGELEQYYQAHADMSQGLI